MNKNMTKFLILAIILCITVGVASATEASSDDATAQDAPTITKNTPTTEKIVAKTENKKINKNNKTTNVKKDTGDLYVSPDVTEAKTGTNEDPTTIMDAVSKVTQNGNIILLPGTTGVYTPTEQIVISDDTTQADTNKFSFTAENTDIIIDASQVENLFKINRNYDITLNNISINNARGSTATITLNYANLTIYGETTYENNAIREIAGGLIGGNGNVIIKGTNTFTNNIAEMGGSVISLAYGNITINGDNTFANTNLISGSESYGGIIKLGTGNLIINGTNKFINNTLTPTTAGAGAVIYAGQDSNITIDGKNVFKNNTLNFNSANYGGGVIYVSGSSKRVSDIKILGENTFEGNKATRGGVMFVNGPIINLTISGNNKFTDNQATVGGALNLVLKANSNVSITGSNIFTNNSISGSGAKGSALYILEQKSITIKSINTTYDSNTAEGNAILVIEPQSSSSTYKDINIELIENKFTNNTVTGNSIVNIVLSNSNTGVLTITNNTFQDNTAQSEYGDTIIHTSNAPRVIENNRYINTPILLSSINLTSDMIDQEVESNTPITLTYNATIDRPRGYDSDLAERLECEVYVNGENKYNGTGNNIIINEEFTQENHGILNVYVKIGTLTSNIIKLKLSPPKSSTNITTENPELGSTTELVAQFYDEEGLPINGGKAIFKVNGKSLRDNEGNVIYVDVVEGKAQLENVNITSEWMKPDTTIQAIYGGAGDYSPIITEKTKITVTKPEADIELTIPEEASAGQTITLQAKVTSGDALVNTGRVVFKLNGKTLKDADGNALYVNVVDGVATTTYTIPAKTKAKQYTLTAVFTDNTFQRSEKEGTITINN